MKKVLNIFLAIIMAIGLSGCFTSDFGISLAGGEIATKPEFNEERFITGIENPTRDDGAQFQGWYTDLSFGEKIDISQAIPEYCDGLIAKWDKCYLFKLVYGRRAFYGVSKGGIIGYFIPAGTYKITMLKDSSARVGSVLICSNSGYSYENGGYPIRQTISFNNGATASSVVITENQHVEITVNSIFRFERVDVDQKYVSSEYDYTLSNGELNEPLIMFVVLFMIIGGVITYKVIEELKRKDI